MNQEISKKLKRNIILKIILPAALCLTVALAGLFFCFYSKNRKTDYKPDLSHLSDEIKGLPVDNYTLSDKNLGYEVSRAIFTKLTDFFELGYWRNPENFLIIKVGDVKILEPENEFDSEIHFVRAKVLKNLYGNCNEDVIQIYTSELSKINEYKYQYSLRKNGVYILPLEKLYKHDGFDSVNKNIEHYDEYYYSNSGSYDVLFEIDDKGLVWSHSQHQGFSRFDGQDYTVLVNEINKVTQDEPFMLAYSNFGKAVIRSSLIEVEMTSGILDGNGDEVMDKDKSRHSLLYCNARVVQNFSMIDMLMPENIKIEIKYNENNNGWKETGENISFENGERYLLFVRKERDSYKFEGLCGGAVILPDGTIKGFETAKFIDKNYFQEYNGSTVEKIKNLANEVNKYYKENKFLDYGFGSIINSSKLIDVVISSDGEKAKYGTLYEAQVNHIYNKTDIPKNIIIRSSINDKNDLKKGTRYLLAVYEDDYYHNGEYLISGLNGAAIIAEDETVQYLPGYYGENTFTNYIGYTLNQIQDLADEVYEYMKNL